uniref:Uncharacterized protein n=1 Tax=Micrurus spixii TaxID=129469 RepID=A0A2D4MHC0_9SAUR
MESLVVISRGGREEGRKAPPCRGATEGAEALFEQPLPGQGRQRSGRGLSPLPTLPSTTALGCQAHRDETCRGFQKVPSAAAQLAVGPPQAPSACVSSSGAEDSPPPSSIIPLPGSSSHPPTPVRPPLLTPGASPSFIYGAVL